MKENNIRKIIRQLINEEINNPENKMWRDKNTYKIRTRKDYDPYFDRTFSGSHPEENYVTGTEDNLEISDDSTSYIVEPFVRRKVREYLKQMKMIP